MNQDQTLKLGITLWHANVKKQSRTFQTDKKKKIKNIKQNMPA